MTVSITRRINTVQEQLFEQFRAVYNVRDFEVQVFRPYRGASASRRMELTATLYDMLRSCGIPFEEGLPMEAYQQLVRQHAPTEAQLHGDIYRFIKQYLLRHPTPGQYMARLLDRLTFEADAAWRADSPRVRILKQCIKYGAYLTKLGYQGRVVVKEHFARKLGGAPKEGQILAALTDADVQSMLGQMQHDMQETRQKAVGSALNARQVKELLKTIRRKYKLITMADDLAQGHFRAQGGTRRDLYALAVVFDMSYAPERAGKDPLSDVEMNLFDDYYQNNMLRVIGEDHSNVTYERAPSGQGVNWKNGEDVIFLYHIARGSGQEAKAIQKTVQSIGEMLNALTKAPGASREEDLARAAQETALWREISADAVMHLDEAAFRAFILENFNQYRDGQGGGMQAMAAKAQRRAYAAYRDYLDKLEALYRQSGSYDRVLRDASSPAFRSFLEAEDAQRRRRAVVKRDDVTANEASFEDLTGVTDGDLIVGLDYRFMPFPPEEERDEADRAVVKLIEETDAYLRGGSDPLAWLRIESAMEMSRTALLNVYHHYQQLRRAYAQDAPNLSFRQVFEMYARDLDPTLDACGYRPISARDVYDLLLMFSTYSDANPM